MLYLLKHMEEAKQRGKGVDAVDHEDIAALGAEHQSEDDGSDDESVGEGLQAMWQKHARHAVITVVDDDYDRHRILNQHPSTFVAFRSPTLHINILGVANDIFDVTSARIGARVIDPKDDRRRQS